MTESKPPRKRKATSRGGYVPSERDRRAVELMVRHGVPLEEIRRVVVNPATGKPVSKTTLTRHFRREIDSGMVQANTEVAESLFRQAVGRARVIVDGEVVEEERAPNTSAAIWWTKARMGWKAGADEDETKAGPEPASAGGKVTIYIPDNGRHPPAARTAGSLPRDAG